MKLQGKRAVVTGAGQGIGRAIGLKLGSLGAEVALVDINKKGAKNVAAEIEKAGGKARVYELDVSDHGETIEMFQKIGVELGGVDILVNNAGITRDNLILRMPPEDWDLVLKVNLTGTFNCIRAVARTMMSQRWGRIVNISSIIGQVGNIGQANYAASKAGIIALTKTAARELGSRGITVNAVAPGFIETPMTESLTDKVRDEFTAKIQLKRLGTPEDVANVVAFLASDDGDYITGQTINVDGGMVW
jgi:3-oxoacyl-[acyl-carrier protein] reductase